MRRLRNHGGAIPEPRKVGCQSGRRPRSVRVTETTIENGTTVSWGRASSGRGRGPRRSGARQGDFFICDMPWAAPKDDMASMEHPLFTLATQPDRRILRYEHGEATIEVTPSVKGLATIHDKDVLIYCVSQLMAAIECRAADGADAAAEGARPPARHPAGDLRRRLPAAARGASSGCRARGSSPTSPPAGSRVDARLRADRRLGDPAQDQGRPDDPRHGDALGLDVPLGGVGVGADAAPGLLRPAQAAGAAGLRDRAQALRPAGGVEDRARDAAEEVGLDLAAAGVPQDDPRHGRGGRAAGLQRWRSTTTTWCWCARAAGWGGGRGRGPGSSPEVHDRVRAAAPGYDPYWLEAEWLRFWQASGRPRLRSPEAAFLAFARRGRRRAPRR